MAVYPICSECGTRRDKCGNVTAHKTFVRWTADVRFTRTSPRMRKTYKTKELADSQVRHWYTDYERGHLKPKLKIIMTFEQVADEWWNRVVLAQNRIKDPQRSENGRVNMWKKLFGSKTVSAIVLEDVEDWVSERREAGIAINTINRDLKPLRWILSYAVEKGYLEKNPADGLKNLKGGNIHDRWMTEEETGDLLDACVKLDDMDLADFVAVGLNTGFRLGNLERLNARDISDGFILARQTKSGTPYEVPVSPDIEPVIRRLIRQHPSGAMLIGRDNNVGERFREAARLAGLYTDSKDNERVTIHTLRHTFAVLYLKRGGDVYKLSKLLGHASVAITDAIYARFCPKEKLKEAPRISTPVPQLHPRLKVI